jgi:hypothetical protein
VGESSEGSNVEKTESGAAKDVRKYPSAKSASCIDLSRNRWVAGNRQAVRAGAGASEKHREPAGVRDPIAGRA